MGELALRKIQAGEEAIPGIAVAATRRVYGVLEPKRDQPRRFAVEDRGILVTNFRANAKLVAAEFKFKGDVLFEDLPWFLEMTHKGGVVPTGGVATGYSYNYTPDLTVDTIKTRTFEWGDESLSWQGPFGSADSLKVTFGTDDVIGMEVDGFVQEWWPATRGGYAGFTGGIAEHNVEGPVGWQTRLFMDVYNPGGTIIPMGTTYIPSRFIKAVAEYKNQNKRKYFGDMGPFYTKMGRGKRAISLSLDVEELDALTYATDLKELAQIIDTNLAGHKVQQLRVRLQVVGSQIAGTTFGTLNGALVKNGAVLATPVNAAFTAGAGTLAAATYWYRVSALNAAGETLASTETSIAAGASTGVNVNWGAVSGATGYRVYGRTTGAELLLATVGAVTTFLDNGSITPSGPLPTVNTTGAYVALVTNALTAAIPGGAALVLGDGGPVVTVLPAGAALSAISVPIVPFNPRTTVLTASNIYRAKSIEFDFYGVLKGDPKWVAHDTNVAFSLDLEGVYDVDDAKADCIKVTNQLPTAISQA